MSPSCRDAEPMRGSSPRPYSGGARHGAGYKSHGDGPAHGERVWKAAQRVISVKRHVCGKHRYEW